MQQAFHECHGLQCGFCTPGFLTTITAYLRAEPATRPRTRPARRSPATCAAAPATRTSSRRCCARPSCRAVARRRRDRRPTRPEAGGHRGRRQARRCSAAGSSAVEDERLLRGDGALPRRPRPRTRCAAAFVRSPHAHARDRRHRRHRRARRRRAWSPIYTYEDLAGAGVAEPLPLLIPHPALTHGRTAVRAGHGRGQPRRRGGRDRGRQRPLRRRGRRATGSGSTYEPLPPVVGIDGRARGDAPRARRRARQRRRAHMRAGDRRRPRRDRRARRTALELDLDVERSASMPLEGRGVLARWDADDAAAAVVDLDPDLDRRAGGGRRQARPAAGQGRRASPRTSAAASG